MRHPSKNSFSLHNYLIFNMCYIMVRKSEVKKKCRLYVTLFYDKASFDSRLPPPRAMMPDKKVLARRQMI